MNGLYHRDRLRTFSTVLFFLAFQAPCSFTSRPTQTSDNDSQKQFMAEKSKNISAVYPSVTLSPRRVKPVSFEPSLQTHFSNFITHSWTTGVVATVNTMSSCEGPICPSLELPWTRARNNQGDNFRVFYKIRGWLILCIIVTGVAFLLVTHHLKRRVQPRLNICSRPFAS